MESVDVKEVITLTTIRIIRSASVMTIIIGSQKVAETYQNF